MLFEGLSTGSKITEGLSLDGTKGEFSARCFHLADSVLLTIVHGWENMGAHGCCLGDRESTCATGLRNGSGGMANSPPCNVENGSRGIAAGIILGR
jgi:hypothetical protein